MLRRPSYLPAPLMLLLPLMHAVVLSPSAVTAGAKMTELIVFGELTVDTGNNDFYSQKLGLDRDFVPPYLDPSYTIQDFAIGVNFASAGADIDDATTNVVVLSSENKGYMPQSCKQQLIMRYHLCHDDTCNTFCQFQQFDNGHCVTDGCLCSMWPCNKEETSRRPQLSAGGKKQTIK